MRLVLSIRSDSPRSHRPAPSGHDNKFILVLIDAFSRWVELFPTKATNALELASCMIQHFGRFGTPEVVHTDRGTAFHRGTGTKQSLTTAYSKEENAIVERANKEVLRHSRTRQHYCLMHVFMTSGRTSNYPWCSVL